MIKIIKKIYFTILAEAGFFIFNFTKKTPNWAYIAFRQRFINSGGKFNDYITKKISRRNGKYDFKNSYGGILSLKNKEDFDNAMSKFRENGYYIFENKIPEEIVNGIMQFAENEPSVYLDTYTNKRTKDKFKIDKNNPLGPRYDYSLNQFINNEYIQKIIFDNSLLEFAQEYLGSKPILDLIAFWWSFPFAGKGKDSAAQMYHFDMDRIKFLKFFVYLTDVDSETGPHCYVKGSHKLLPSMLTHDGRYTDDEIEKIFGKENMIEIIGQRGTIMVVDTRGFHKGKELTMNHRLLFQVEFANSMFGQKYPPAYIQFTSDKYRKLSNEFPTTYKEILVDVKNIS